MSFANNSIEPPQPAVHARAVNHPIPQDDISSATDPTRLRQEATSHGVHSPHDISGPGPAFVVTPSGNTMVNADMHDISRCSNDPRAVVDMSHVASGHLTASGSAALPHAPIHDSALQGPPGTKRTHV